MGGTWKISLNFVSAAAAILSLFLGVNGGMDRDVLMVLMRCGEMRLKLVGRERAGLCSALYCIIIPSGIRRCIISAVYNSHVSR